MRYIKTLLTLALIACLSACENTQAPNAVVESPATSAEASATTAKVSETEAIEEVTMESEGFFMPCTNGSYLIIIDVQGPTEMYHENGDNSIYDDLSVGDTIKVTHSEIEETYPGLTIIYSIEKISDGALSDIPADTLASLEELGWLPVSAKSETTQTMTPTVLDRETDRRIRSDYAAFVSARDNKEITIDQVTGQFYYGDDNGYMLLVMCPYPFYTLEEKEYTFENNKEDDHNDYTQIDIILPSGMFELFAYKDGSFTDIETAVNEKLISYEAVSSIAAYMKKYYTEGDQTCVYNTKHQ